MKLTKEDRNQLEKIGVSLEAFNRQLDLIINGTDKVQLVSAATIGNGITKWNEEEFSNFVKSYNIPEESLEIVRFIPASGAATRMFKDLIKFWKEGEPNSQSETFFSNLEKFPFYKRLKRLFPDLFDVEMDVQNQRDILSVLLEDDNFNYMASPKGLVPFHWVDGKERSPFEEHFHEAVFHSGENKNVCLHFTVSLSFRDHIREVLNNVKSSFDNPPITFNFSLQSNSTDTVALTQGNEIVRKSNGEMLFRPGGHGSLLKNLNNIHADLIFIRNIDNIIPTENIPSDMTYDKAMAGFLQKMVNKRNKLLLALEVHSENQEVIQEAQQFIEQDLRHSAYQLDIEDGNLLAQIKENLNRPMRVCGMVKNVGEPGGGPYKVVKNGITSLQIIESSQISSDNEDQMRIMAKATHFNPVDIVCATRDHHGEKYNLMEFSQVETSFIASKTYDNQDIKALEWPGLWNGAMYKWITFFVEVPLETFNPVKTVNDLLRSNHQPLK
jgi:hypothetical protein